MISLKYKTPIKKLTKSAKENHNEIIILRLLMRLVERLFKVFLILWSLICIIELYKFNRISINSILYVVITMVSIIALRLIDNYYSEVFKNE